MGWIRGHWDWVGFGLFSLIHILAWFSIRGQLKAERAAQTYLGVEERSLGASAMGSAASAGITAVSILIPASLLIAMTTDNRPDPATLQHLQRGGAWLLLSLLCGLCMSYLIPLRTFKSNPARRLDIGILLGPQLISLFIGVVHIVMALHSFK